MPLVPVKIKPAKVAIPLEIVAVAPAVIVPPLEIVAVIVPPAPTITLPPESVTLAIGCWARTTPLVAVVEGWVVIRILLAAPTLMAIVWEVEVRLPSVKVKV